MPQTTAALYPEPRPDMWKFPSRRSVVHSTDGIVACTQPLAAKCGLEVLRAGGNAADAAVAVAAGLNMTEPCSTGIGGDMFILYWDAATKKVSAMNGSGRSGANCTLERIRADLGADSPSSNLTEIPMKSVHAVTVPGAAAGWVDTVERFGSGKVSLEQVLSPAIALGEKGFPVSEVAAYYNCKRRLTSVDVLSGTSPKSTSARRRPTSPRCSKGPLRRVGGPRPARRRSHEEPDARADVPCARRRGQAGLLRGPRGRGAGACGARPGRAPGAVGPAAPPRGRQRARGAHLARLQRAGLGRERGVELWEHPPNGQGIVALMALGIVQELERQGSIPVFGPDDFNSTAYLHAIIEALRLGFADAHWFVTDPNVTPVPTEGLISQAYLAERAKLFDPKRAAPSLHHGEPPAGVSPALRSSDTVYFTVTDAQGNAASFINSNYAGFGTSIIPKGCGFTLQNRGANFSLDAAHPNRLEPRKRPYHTIIPGMVTNLADGSLHSTFGVMGGFMQPQGHVQVLLGQLIAGLDPQQALDAPRVCIGAGIPEDGSSTEVEWTVNIEEGMPAETIEGLRRLGHKVEVVGGAGRGLFGRGQIVRQTVDAVDGTFVWSAGSDMRADGAAYPA
ncbi:hypothetical protein ACCO45_000095 [Purpureocillium lilacinum]|uniref:Uncharacterized protein n=1 Tax=Purpureocillium lilacinum TaxID=33203 RepID=A0ACC4E352_PURLI